MHVPNRGGEHRALTPIHESMYASMYANMGDKQLKAVHDQATSNTHIDKYKERIKYTTPEMESRGL